MAFSSRWKGLFLSLPHMRQSFPQNEKLKRQLLIERLFEEGRAIKIFPVKAILLEDPALEQTQAAFSVPKKNFKKAVDRNRIKRQLREAYRLHKDAFLSKSGKKFAVIFIYLGKELPAYSQLENTMVSVLKRCF